MKEPRTIAKGQHIMEVPLNEIMTGATYSGEDDGGFVLVDWEVIERDCDACGQSWRSFLVDGCYAHGGGSYHMKGGVGTLLCPDCMHVHGGFITYPEVQA